MTEAPEWAVSDELWEQIAPLIPPVPLQTHGGRPRMDNRKAFNAIIYVLRSEARWSDLPRELGAPSTVHGRFQEWLQAGLFQALWKSGLTEHEELFSIRWDWAAENSLYRNKLVKHHATTRYRLN